MQVGDTVRVVNYDSTVKADPKVNGKTGTIIHISPVTGYFEVDLGFAPYSELGIKTWLFLDRELEVV